jgi:hypothetical protein
VYSWKAQYIAALCEMDQKKLPGLLLKAAEVIEQRLRHGVDRSSDEERELKNAQQIISVMKKTHSL